MLPLILLPSYSCLSQRAGQFNGNKTNLKEIRKNRGNPNPKKDSSKVNRQPTGSQMGAPPDDFNAAISRLEKQERDPEAPRVLRDHLRQDAQRDNLRSRASYQQHRSTDRRRENTHSECAAQRRLSPKNDLETSTQAGKIGLTKTGWPPYQSTSARGTPQLQKNETFSYLRRQSSLAQ
ncbi:unnamed protein product [Echinostoma caproni]|uniref:SUZ domain-containing protein n=1 Tax=Echinostoma caproni TaxID=27848 RepID=A0A183A296_9TREM|nr:unnamed protein product [Echinostoma caproni]